MAPAHKLRSALSIQFYHIKNIEIIVKLFFFSTQNNFKTFIFLYMFYTFIFGGRYRMYGYKILIFFFSHPKHIKLKEIFVFCSVKILNSL